MGESAPVAADRFGRDSRRDLLAILAGLGQIMFQNCALTGVFFLTGIALVSPLMALGAAVGAICGTATAHLLHYDRAEIYDGIYGYNASLVGIALLAFHQPVLLTILIAALGAILATVATHALRASMPLPTYTVPFIVTTWLAQYAAQELHVPVVVHAPAAASAESVPVAAAVFRGISEVMLQSNVLTGVLFLIGILLCSWKGAVWALAGSLLGLLIGIEDHVAEQSLSLGIYGYNAALAAMALALYRPSVLLPTAGAVLSVPITEKFPLTGLSTLTAPFVLASWAIIVLDKIDATLERSATERPH